MTEPGESNTTVIIATMIIAAVPSIIGSITAAVISVLAFMKARENSVKTAEIKEITDSTHKIVNSQRTEMTEKIDTLSNTISELKKDAAIAEERKKTSRVIEP